MENLTVFSPAKRDFARKMSNCSAWKQRSICYRTDTKRSLAGNWRRPANVYRPQVNIVRALTNRPHVLALDEANMVLDGVAEPALIRALETLRGSFDGNPRNTPSIPAGPLRSSDSR